MPPRKKNQEKIIKFFEPMRVNFNEEESQKFKDLQKTTGINGKSDLLRFCLSFTHNVYLKKIIQETEAK